MATISERIQEAMYLNNLKQSDLVEKTGISKGALSSYISGRYTPKQQNIFLISKALNVNEAWLMGNDVPMQRNAQVTQSGAVVIPVLGRVAAGIPLTAAEYIIDTEEISQAMANDGEYFGLQVKGDSMEPRIKNGDVVIVRKQSDADDGDLVIALVNGDDAVVKRLKKYKDGIAKWTYDDIPTKLWPITPLSKMWSIGSRMEARLNAMGLYYIGDIARYDKKLLKKK